MQLRPLACLGAFLVWGCGPIGGVVVGGDSAGTEDAGAAIDAGAGATPEAGPTADAGARDAGSAADAGGGQGPAPSAPGGYTVSGATIYTRDHVPRLFHGLDRPSLEWSAAGDQLSESDYMKMAGDWKANVV